MGKIKFGTDGWRAVISEDFTFDNVKITGQAIADFINNEQGDIYRKRKIVLGYDTRFLSDKYAQTIASVLAANGINVVLSDRPATTPSVCVYIKDKQLTGGVMITASHNPYYYNGVKYKGFFGGSAGSDIIDKIEKYLYKNEVKFVSLDEALKDGRVSKADLVGLQLKYVKKYADMKTLKKAKFRVLVDSMNGTGRTYLADVLKGSGIKLDFINADINPNFNNRPPEPNEKHLKGLMKMVKKGKYSVGIATDGDSDRLAIVDDNGKILSGHKMMALLFLHLLKNRKMEGGVVQTICGTGLINRMAGEYGSEVFETPVGFKYICEMMYTRDILIGGEETGGVGFKNYVPERDGFLSALLILELMACEKKKLSAIVSGINGKYGNFVYEREDIIFPGDKREALMNGLNNNHLDKVLDKKVTDIKDYDGVKYICEDGTWLLIRLSGTEPKLRIYSETSSKKRSLEYIEFGKKYAFGLM